MSIVGDIIVQQIEEKIEKLKWYMQTARIERTILSNLMNNEDYARNVLPFLQSDYFHDGSEKLVFKTITDAFDKYNKPPTSEQLIITLNEAYNVPEPEFKSSVEIIISLDTSHADVEWLTDATEKFCKDKAIYNAVAQGIQIIEGKDKKFTRCFALSLFI